MQILLYRHREVGSIREPCEVLGEVTVVKEETPQHLLNGLIGGPANQS